MLRFLQRWGVPIGMTGAYAALAWSSQTSTTGKAWMAIGLAFVFVLWWLFRFLTESAALSRAVAVGDATRMLELTEGQLRRRKRPAARAPYLVFRAHAYELRGEWARALATIEEAGARDATTRPSSQLLADAVRIAALVETGRIAEARRVLDHELTPLAATLDPRLHASAYLFARLATGRVRQAEGAQAEARVTFQAVLDDIRAGGGLRAVAHAYLAKLAEPDDPAAAERHRAEIVKLVPDASAWVRQRPAARQLAS